MKFYSTQQKNQLFSFAEAVLKGLAEDGGLFMPAELPSFSPVFFENLNPDSFSEVAFTIASRLLRNDVPEEVLEPIITEAFDFDVPLVTIEPDVAVLELFHGPTLAFKDFGARFMARITAFLVRNRNQPLTILVATSGDTGSAVGNAFFKVPGIQVFILYPGGKVSSLQEKQLTTIGHNITALEIDGSFDDCQRLVKTAFLDHDLTKKLCLTSANSINIARLLPQAFYYCYAYAGLSERQRPVIISVPSGNFGNLTAGLMAKKMGLPVARFVAATNINDVVLKYLQTGKYEPAPMKKTLSNAMDVGNPSNFARIVELYEGNIDKIRADIWGAPFTDEQTKWAMKQVFENTGYLLDPHGAVGYLGLKKFLNHTAQPAAGIFLETAHPAKFVDVVETIINQPIAIPARLKAVLAGKKQAVQLSNRYGALKAYLMSLK